MRGEGGLVDLPDGSARLLRGGSLLLGAAADLLHGCHDLRCRATDLLYGRGKLVRRRRQPCGIAGVGRTQVGGKTDQRLGGVLRLRQGGGLLVHAAQRLAGGPRLLFGRGRDRFGPPLGIARRSFRFPRGKRDRLACRRQRGEILAQFAEGSDQRLPAFRFGGGGARRRLDHVGNETDLFLDPVGQPLHVARTLLRRLSEQADLVGYDRKTTAVVTSARRLDGGVERQKVGLVGNLPHRSRHVANGDGLVAQIFDERYGARLAFPVRPDVGGPGAYLRGRISQQLLQRFGTPPRRSGAVTRAHQGGGDRCHGGERFLRCARRLLGAARDLLHRAPQLLRSEERV